MCNRARFSNEPETLVERFGGGWMTPKPMDNRFNPKELFPKSRAYVIREEDGARGLDVMSWDVTAGQAPWPMTNVRNLGLAQWRALAARPENRCLIPLTEFCEWSPKPVDQGDGNKPLKGEMWFDVTDQDVFMIAGLWRQIGDVRYFAMVTCDPNELVAPIHPKAMITVVPAGSLAHLASCSRPAWPLSDRQSTYPRCANSPSHLSLEWRFFARRKCHS